ncbi:MAG: hypothetical protein H6625_02300 [Bdellovibrionaceae bacterium]|nr:hypothetical protein [Pseudobdellovibrionaceae bacterium]
MPEANKYLKISFIPRQWNKLFMVNPESKESFYRPCQKKLSNILVLKEYRRVSKDQTISLGCQDHLVEGPQKLFLARHQIELRTDNSNETQAYFAGKKLTLKKLKNPSRKSQDELDTEIVLKAVQLADKL